MNDIFPETPTTIPFEQLLLRDDTWMGHSQRFISRSTVGTGYDRLNQELLNEGWPLSCLIEVCQRGIQGEWQLFTPALLEMPGLVVLLNPPAEPFSQALIQSGIDLDRLIVVSASKKKQFIPSFIELTRTNIGSVLAWQPDDALSYTELRKCLLATVEGKSLSVLFRPSTAQQQSSPAALRLFAQIIPSGLEITLFKQKGYLQTQQPRPIVLTLPQSWKPTPAYHALNQTAVGIKQDAKPQRLANVVPLRGKS